MNILALDSNAVAASAAVARDDKTLAVCFANNGNTHSEILLPMAETALENAHLTVNDIDLFACTVGPGSFTGVRIGVATVKGLAFGRNKPCAAVSTTEALAEGLAPLSGILVGVMDARRGQVYAGIFTYRDGALVRLAPDRAMQVDELAREVLAAYPEQSIRLAGDGYSLALTAFREAGAAHLTETPPALRLQNAEAVARCAIRLARAGETVDDKSLRPLYLRLPQAERDFLEKQADHPA